jgi:hypothetical protein
MQTDLPLLTAEKQKESSVLPVRRLPTVNNYQAKSVAKEEFRCSVEQRNFPAEQRKKIG